MREFGIFLSHNSKGKPAVRGLKGRLESRGIRVWLDEDQVIPGQPWQPVLEEGVRGSGVGAVLVGRDGLGPWENIEMQALLARAVKDGKPVIPVLLPEAPEVPQLPVVLYNFMWVDLRAGFSDEGLDKPSSRHRTAMAPPMSFSSRWTSSPGSQPWCPSPGSTRRASTVSARRGLDSQMLPEECPLPWHKGLSGALRPFSPSPSISPEGRQRQKYAESGH